MSSPKGQPTWSLSASQLNAKFTAGELTAEAIVQTFLNRIDRFDGQIGAFNQVLGDASLETAREQDRRKARGEPLGRLAGVPIAIKDLLHVDSALTTCGSNAMRNYTAPFDATAVAHLRSEDAILIGKTNLDAFGMGSLTQNSDLRLTRNPWNPAHSAGGSSGGSAAAVAARFCPLALGTDTGGSIRQPASYCGVFGFKPTYGRVSRYGMVAYASSCDQIGPLAHSAEDLPLIFETIQRPCSLDAMYREINAPGRSTTTTLAGARIGHYPPFQEKLSKPMREIFITCLDRLQTAGAQLIEIDLSELRHALATYYIIASAEASTNLARFDGVRYGAPIADAPSAEAMSARFRSQMLGPEVKRRILMGTFVLSAGHRQAFYDKALRVRTRIAESLASALRACDLIALPTAPGCAPRLGASGDPTWEYLLDTFTTPSNLAGLPAISIPAALNEALPWGLQFMAAKDEDEFLIRTSALIAQIMRRDGLMAEVSPELQSESQIT